MRRTKICPECERLVKIETRGDRYEFFNHMNGQDLCKNSHKSFTSKVVGNLNEI